jgi:hypothetical protein
MGSVRQVVALHKDRTVMPLTMVVQKLCGIGNDAIFMSVLRPAVESDPSLVKVWITNAGGAASCQDTSWHTLIAGDFTHVLPVNKAVVCAVLAQCMMMGVCRHFRP